jgi:uncharacterized membrane protein
LKLPGNQGHGHQSGPPVQQLNVILSVVLATWLLDETLTPLLILRSYLVILGPVIMLRDRRKISLSEEPIRM